MGHVNTPGTLGSRANATTEFQFQFQIQVQFQLAVANQTNSPSRAQESISLALARRLITKLSNIHCQLAEGNFAIPEGLIHSKRNEGFYELKNRKNMRERTRNQERVHE